MEERVLYGMAVGGLLQSPCNPATIEQEGRTLSTRNVDELESELVELERRLLPLLNAIRTMRGKKPIYEAKGSR